MKKILFAFLFSAASIVSNAQVRPTYITGDTVELSSFSTKGSTLRIKNTTLARTGSFLKNYDGKGDTKFAYALDSAYVSGGILYLLRSTHDTTLVTLGTLNPTWQQTLIAGSILTQNNTVTNDGHTFKIIGDNSGYRQMFKQGNDHVQGMYLENTSNAVLAQVSTGDLDSSVVLNSTAGNVLIKNLKAGSSTDSVITFDYGANRVHYRNASTIVTTTFFNIKKYGADTSLSDNTTAIQAAVDAAAVHGGTVYIPSGRYYVYSINLPANVNVMGDGTGSILKTIAAYTFPIFQEIFTPLTSSPTKIEKLYLNGNGSCTYPLYFQNVFETTVSEVTITSFATAGIYIRGMVAGTFNKVTISGGINCIDAGNSGLGIGFNLNTFTDCRFFNATSYAAKIDRGGSVQFKSCDFEVNGTLSDSTTGCIKYTNTAEGVGGNGIGLVVSGCWFEQNYGILINIGNPTYGAVSTIENTVVSYSPSGYLYAVKISGTGSFANKVYFKSNTFNVGGSTKDIYVNGSNSYAYTDIGSSYSTKITSSGNIVAGGSSGLTVGTTAITSGTSGRVEYNNAGVLGEYPIIGTGNVVMSASPTFTGTPITPLLTMDNGASNPVFRLNSKSGVTNPSAGFVYMSSSGASDRITTSVNAYFDGTSWNLIQASKPSWLVQLRDGEDDYALLRAPAGTSSFTQVFNVNGSGTVQMGAYGAGTATFDASGNITSVSDERLKRNIKYSNTGLAQVLQLKPITYKYNFDSKLDTVQTYSGFSAQNVKANIPFGTGQTQDGYLTLQDRAIMGALVNSVKELNAKIISQQKEIEKLKKKK